MQTTQAADQAAQGASGPVAALWTGAALLVPLVVSGCGTAPSQNILGSFFPAWILCGALGLCAAVACRLVLGAIGLNQHVLAPPLSYLAVAVAVAVFIWLLQFGQ